MKGQSPRELDLILDDLQALVGGFLQKLMVSDHDLVLGIWTKAGMRWCWMDLHVHQPSLWYLKDLPAGDLKAKNPLLLFLRAHGEGQPLVRIRREESLGRVLHFQFGDGNKTLDLELRLIPHGVNAIARTDSKQVSWNPVKELAPMGEVESEQARDISLLKEQWLKRFSKKTSQVTEADIGKQYEKELEKKQKVLAKVEEELHKKENSLWREVGEWIKTHQSLDVPSKWQAHVDKSLSLSQNIELSFKKAKENEAKLQGTRERREQLRRECKELESLSPSQWFQNKKAQNQKAKPRSLKEKVKARSLDLAEGLKAFFGKSGADNLKLLRQARPWDYWVHLKDEPGSHGILFRNKNQEVSFKAWEQVAQKLVEYSLGEKSRERKGDRFQMIICECRHVKPIKGDHLGRVNYQNPQMHSFIYSA